MYESFAKRFQFCLMLANDQDVPGPWKSFQNKIYDSVGTFTAVKSV